MNQAFQANAFQTNAFQQFALFVSTLVPTLFMANMGSFMMRRGG